MITDAIRRGMTSASIGETPMVRIASISSVIFIVPICAAKAEPERPATMIAVISVPSSRTVIRPIRLMVYISAPNCSSWTAPCWAMTMPIRKLISPMMPSARTPTTSKRWTTALKRKRLGWRMRLAKPIRVAPKKPSRPTRVRPSSTIHSPSSRATPIRPPRLLGADPHRLVGFGDLVEQALGFLARADDLGAAVADGAVDEPGADRVHALDPAEVDRQRVGLGGDFAGGACGAGDGDRARHPIGAAVP